MVKKKTTHRKPRINNSESLIDTFMVLVTWGVGILSALYVLAGYSGVIQTPTEFKGFGIEVKTTSLALFIMIFCIVVAFIQRDKTRPAFAKMRYTVNLVKSALLEPFGID